MKKVVVVALTLAMVLTMALGSGAVLAGNDLNGNGVPSGAHYNLNIIGVDNPKDVDFDGGEGHRIFVDLNGKSKIGLQEGEEFRVIDANGTGGSMAKFQLPNPDPDNTGTTVYSVFLRVLGTPNGKIKMTTCATDPVTGELICSDFQVIEVRDSPAHGNNKFSNVSAELLYIYAWIWDAQAGDYTYQRVPLFSDVLQDYFWSYDNNGCKIAQLRFYEGYATEVPDPDEVAHLLSISPESSPAGTTLDVTITGTVDLPDADDVDFTGIKAQDIDFGDDITVNDFVVGTSTNELTVIITIDAAADTGWRRVSFTLKDRRTLTIPFEVEPV